jgi:hypothetical protein
LFRSVPRYTDNELQHCGLAPEPVDDARVQMMAEVVRIQLWELAAADL